MITRELIVENLKRIIDSKSGKDIVSLGIVSGIVIKGVHVGFALEHSQSVQDLKKRCEEIVKLIPGVQKVTIIIPSNKTKQKKISIEGVKKIIVVASGKGGVGKSTIALNLALSLTKLNYRTALVDSDIYGPSIPKMLGTENLKPRVKDGKVLPIEKYGLQTISIGYFIDDNRAAIWRGPMVTKALYNLLMQSKWYDIEYLIIDTPPGTGDIHLSLAEKFELNGAVIVSTPQKLALADARKACDLLKKLNVPIIGVVENMSYFIQNNSKIYIFGKEGVKQMAKELKINLLGRIPIDSVICQAADGGNPFLINQDITKIYEGIAKSVSLY
ncbi:MAG: Mrp/NBP35 family ATP-binding protein [Wolbachia endosymbiont of Fragariocoptes setiger]|nr:Mrp/NBP35 family ATP-binding protein [Wolbachia endosymbiont of Fragariocoptes setiger]